jgi:hypothetical protein
MLEVAFSCPACSRLFLQDCPYDGPVPLHLDALLGTACPASGTPLTGYLEIPEHLHAQERQDGWPRWDVYNGNSRRRFASRST